jgi:hypothetical protein
MRHHFLGAAFARDGGHRTRIVRGLRVTLLMSGQTHRGEFCTYAKVTNGNCHHRYRDSDGQP